MAENVSESAVQPIVVPFEVLTVHDDIPAQPANILPIAPESADKVELSAAVAHTGLRQAAGETRRWQRKIIAAALTATVLFGASDCQSDLHAGAGPHRAYGCKALVSPGHRQGNLSHEQCGNRLTGFDVLGDKFQGNKKVEEFNCLDEINMAESKWRTHADSPTSSAYGVPQGMLSAHPEIASGKGKYFDFRYNPRTQLEWQIKKYIPERYGTPCDALAFRRIHKWY